MSAAWVWLVAAGAAAFLGKSWWNYRSLPVLPPAGRSKPDVTVIIPARNEEATIGRVVKSFPGVPVIVVDDQSRDLTAKVAQQAGAVVISAPDLPTGWLGKPHACWTGAQRAHTAWLLFVDADTWYGPTMAGALCAYAERERLDLVSVFLQQQRVTWAERILLPYAFALYFAGVSARRVNRTPAAEALANGQCLLFSREAYDRLGGHRAVAGSVIEDVALAEAARVHGLRTRVLRGESLGSVRMYDGLGSIWKGFEKNSFRFLLVNPWSGLQVVLASVTLTSYLPVLAYLLREGDMASAAAFALLPTTLLWPWYGGADALLAPLAIYLFQAIALAGMWTSITGRKVLWKGRPVS